jgi:hypothetical protein
MARSGVRVMGEYGQRGVSIKEKIRAFIVVRTDMLQCLSLTYITNSTITNAIVYTIVCAVTITNDVVDTTIYNIPTGSLHHVDHC